MAVAVRQSYGCSCQRSYGHSTTLLTHLSVPQADWGAPPFVIQMSAFVIRIFLCIFYAYSVHILVRIWYSSHIPIISYIV